MSQDTPRSFNAGSTSDPTDKKQEEDKSKDACIRYTPKFTCERGDSHKTSHIILKVDKNHLQLAFNPSVPECRGMFMCAEAHTCAYGGQRTSLAAGSQVPSTLLIETGSLIGLLLNR